MRKFISTLFKKRSSSFEAVKTALRLVQDAADAFPPLQSTVRSILAIIELIETTENNIQEAIALASHLHALPEVLQAHPAEIGVERLIGSLDEEIAKFTKVQERGRISRLINAAQDASVLASVLPALSAKINLFVVETLLAMQQVAKESLKLAKMAQLRDELHPIRQAMYDMDAPVPRGPCTANTRANILTEIMQWANNPSDHTIYCLNGMAGTGKTTIAYSLCQNLKTNDCLGASFFCSHADQDCCNAANITRTIAYQIACCIPEFLEKLLAILKNRNLSHSFRHLITEPLMTLSPTPHSPKIVVIDAVDECTSDQHIRELFSDLLTISSSSQIKFFITFRPDPPVQCFIRNYDSVLHKFHLHDVEKSLVSHDIHLFLTEKLETIVSQRQRENGITISNWPSHEDLTALVQLSGGLFIFASTACEYIDGKGDIRERLRWTLTSSSERQPSIQQTGKIDELYQRILREAFNGLEPLESNQLSNIIRVIITAYTPLRCNDISDLLQVDNATILQRLTELHSVIYIPANGGPISTLHASFPDFLANKARSCEPYLSIQQSHRLITFQSLILLSSSLHENICSLPNPPSTTLFGKRKTINDHLISGALSYACLHWGMHWYSSGNYSDFPELHPLIQTFFSESTLMWIECLSYRGGLYAAIRMLRVLEGWISHPSHDTIRDFIHETRRFISLNIGILSDDVLETYRSALVWLPASSLLRQKFVTPSRQIPRVTRGLPQQWEASETFWCQELRLGFISSVAFSSDYIAASCYRGIWIWDVCTGKAQILNGHSKKIQSVAFSPDGERLISCSADGHVRMWNSRTGEQVQEASNLMAPASVHSVAFSPDGDRIALGLRDNTVRIWDYEIGEELHTLTGHAKRVTSVAFSPDGKRVISGSHDRTVREWDVGIRGSVGVSGIDSALFDSSNSPLNGHNCPSSQRFFRNTVIKRVGKRLSTSTNYRTFRLTGGIVYDDDDSDEDAIKLRQKTADLVGWRDVQAPFAVSDAGEVPPHLVRESAQRGIFEEVGEAGATIEQVGDTIPRGYVCEDCGDHIKLGGVLNASKSGHTEPVSSIAFFPDGLRFASGSWDTTVRVWDVGVEKEVRILTGHSGGVNSIAISPDCHRIASGSNDRTVRVWNSATGEQLRVFDGHLDSVTSVDFSPDGQRIASGSKDNTVRVWDGGLDVEMLSGHSACVNRLFFTPDKKRLVSSSKDDTIRVWDVDTGKEVLTLNAVFPGRRWVGVSDCGKYIVESPCILEEKFGKVPDLQENDYQVWDAGTGQKLKIVIPSDIMSTKFPTLFDFPRLHWVFDPVFMDAPVCWLPAAYRGYHTSASSSNLVALGYNSGKIVILVSG